MLLRRRSLAELINALQHQIFLAILKLGVCTKIAQDQDSYREVYRNITLPSTLMGIPITPTTLIGIYLASALRSLTKAYRIILKIESRLKNSYPEIYTVVAPNINSVKHELEKSINIAKQGRNIDEVIKEIRDCIERANNAISKIRDGIPSYLLSELK
ncbi:MAG TPA: hypothetical protein EYP90_09305 [Chromatiaceae bacterium]|nr:hypothetical protein [Chromatiaceae bacterium]